MRKSAAAVAFLLLLVPAASAQPQYDAGIIAPDSSLYPIDLAIDELGMSVASFDDATAAKVGLRVMSERAAEIGLMIQKERFDLVALPSGSYSDAAKRTAESISKISSGSAAPDSDFEKFAEIEKEFEATEKNSGMLSESYAQLRAKPDFTEKQLSTVDSALLSVRSSNEFLRTKTSESRSLLRTRLAESLSNNYTAADEFISKVSDVSADNATSSENISGEPAAIPTAETTQSDQPIEGAVQTTTKTRGGGGGRGGGSGGGNQNKVFDFSMDLTSVYATRGAGQSAFTSAKVLLISGEPQQVSFACSGLPAGAVCSFSPAACLPSCSSNLTIKTFSDTPAGTYDVSVIASGGGKTVTRGYRLALTAPSNLPHITLNSPQSASVGQEISLLISYTHDSFDTGTAAVMWPDQSFDIVDAAGCTTYTNPVFATGWEGIECGMTNSLAKTFKLKAIAPGNQNVYYRAASSSSTFECGDGTSDKTRDPVSGTCSPTCRNFPGDWETCDSKTKVVSVGTDAPPVVSVSASSASPDSGQTVTLTAAATDDIGVSKIEIFMDGSPAPSKTCSSSPCAYVSGPFSSGTHTYSARATDTSGQTKQSSTGSFTVQQTSQCQPLSASSATANGDDGTNFASSAVDGNSATRWSGPGPGSWIKVDLGSLKTACSIDVSWYRGNLRKNNFTISVSSDGSSFTNVYRGTSSGATTSAESYDFADVSARYVMVTIDKNTENTWGSISEIVVRGYGSSSPPSSGLDKFGIKMIYPTASGGQEYFTKTDALTVTDFMDGGRVARLPSGFSRNPDGTWNIPAGTTPRWVITGGWRNVEMTMQLKINSGTLVQLYSNGEQHTTDRTGAWHGSANKMRVYSDGRMGFIKELYHESSNSGYTSEAATKDNGPDITGRWVTVKFVGYNVNSNTQRKLEAYVSVNNDNSFVKVAEYTDAGSWCASSGFDAFMSDMRANYAAYVPKNRDTGAEMRRCETITWRGDWVSFRSDGADYDFANVSVREIQASASAADNPAPEQAADEGLALSIYAPNAMNVSEATMQRYMVRAADMLAYQSRFSSDFPGITVAEGGASIAGVQNTVGFASSRRIGVIGYDFEHWTDTPEAEQSDPVGSFDRAAKVVHDAGYKFMFNPDGEYLFDTANGVPYYMLYHWENADYALLQLQAPRFAGGTGTDVAAFKKNVDDVVGYARSRNPNIVVFVQLSLRFDSPQTIIAKTRAINTSADGVVYFFNPYRPDCLYCTLENLHAVLTDLRPAVTPPAISVDTPPTLSVAHYPAYPSSTRTVEFTVNAGDDAGLSSIQVFVDGASAGSCAVSGKLATCMKTGGPYAAGSSHAYYARATDTSGKTTKSDQKNFNVQP